MKMLNSGLIRGAELFGKQMVESLQGWPPAYLIHNQLKISDDSVRQKKRVTTLRLSEAVVVWKVLGNVSASKESFCKASKDVSP